MHVDLRTAVARVIRSNTDGWTHDFALTIATIPKALVDGRLTEALLDAYPDGTEYPKLLSRAIATQAGLLFVGDPGADEPGALSTYGEGVGMAVEAMRALRTGTMCYVEADDRSTWQFYRDNVEANGLTIGAIRDFTTGMTWTQAAQLLVDASNTPLDEANPREIPDAGGFVTRWLRPGDYSDTRGYLEEGEFGMGLVGGVTELIGTAAELAEFGQRVATRWQSPIVTALAELGDAAAEMFEGDATGWTLGLDCRTADALADVLKQSGHADTAARLIAEHAHADDEPIIDRHADIRALALADQDNAPLGSSFEYELRDEAAAEYVNNL